MVNKDYQHVDNCKMNYRADKTYSCCYSFLQKFIALENDLRIYVVRE